MPALTVVHNRSYCTVPPRMDSAGLKLPVANPISMEKPCIVQFLQLYSSLVWLLLNVVHGVAAMYSRCAVKLRVHYWMLVLHLKSLVKKKEDFSTPWKLLESQLDLFAKLAKVVNQALAHNEPLLIYTALSSCMFISCTGKQHQSYQGYH